MTAGLPLPVDLASVAAVHVRRYADLTPEQLEQVSRDLAVMRRALIRAMTELALHHIDHERTAGVRDSWN